MKIDRVTFIKTFQVGLSQWEKVGLEASIDDHENPKESLEILKREVEDFHRQSNPQLYKNGNEALVEGFYSYGSGVASGAITSSIIPTINRKYDEMKAVIEDCHTLEELAKHKEYCGKHPDLMPHYMNKLKSLTGGVKV